MTSEEKPGPWIVDRLARWLVDVSLEAAEQRRGRPEQRPERPRGSSSIETRPRNTTARGGG